MLLKSLHLAKHLSRQLTTKMVGVISCKEISYLSQEKASKIDEELFSVYGFKVEQLMELAGLASAKAVHAQYSKDLGRVLVLCGPGNNGGDGFVCARHLQLFGFDPVIVYPKESRNELMKSLVQQCKGMDIPVLSCLPDLSSFSLFVDALFGFSFSPPVRQPFDDIIERVVDSGIFTFCIDIPSGWHVENGPPPAGCPSIRPHTIISLTAPKECVRNWTGPHFVGGRFVPRSLVARHQLKLPEYPDADQIVKLE